MGIEFASRRLRLRASKCSVAVILLAPMLSASSIQVGGIPIWASYTVTAIANGVNGCANANGCWHVNGVLGANKSAALTQSVTLVQLPANGYVSSFRYKTATACAGTTTLLAGLGTASSPNLFLVSAVTGYNLQAAVSATNISVAVPLVQGSDTTAAVNLVVFLDCDGSQH